MNPESHKGAPSQEGEKPINMNNFYLNLPDGSYRNYGDSAEKAQVMKSIDELLAGDFKHLDVRRIYQDIMVAERAMAEALNSGRYKTYEELKQALAPKLEAGKKAREELRPLFDKLVEMGFSPEVLAR